MAVRRRETIQPYQKEHVTYACDACGNPVSPHRRPAGVSLTLSSTYPGCNERGRTKNMRTFGVAALSAGELGFGGWRAFFMDVVCPSPMTITADMY